MTRHGRMHALWRLLGSLTVGTLLGASVTAGPEHPGSDRAASAVTAMVKKYQGLSAFEQTARHTMKMESGGRKQVNEMPARFVYRKPNRFRYQVTDPQGGIVLVSNGRSLWVHSKSLGRYTVQEAPPDMPGVKATLGQWGLTYMDALAFLQGADPLGGVESLRHLGTAPLNGIPVEIVELRGTPRELQMPNSITRLYIGKADRLLYKTVTSSHTFTPPESPVPGSRPVRSAVVMTKTFSQMKVNRPAPDSAFLFTPPAGAQRVSSF